MPTLRTLLLPLLLGLAGCSTSGPRSYDCQYAALPIVIDGQPDDAGWIDAPWTEYFVDIEGDAQPRPRFRTRIRMAWDSEAFYVYAWMDEPHVWGTLTEHDQIVFHDNDFEVFIDPDGDTRNYYEIEINALGTIFDLFLHRRYLDGGPADHDWNAAGLQTAVFIDGTLNDPSDIDLGWAVEMAIPWSNFAELGGRRTPPGENDVWRINYSRVQWQHTVENGAYVKVPDTPENNWVWTPQYAINMHLPRHWGFVRFVR